MKQVIKCIIFIVLFCIFLNCTFSILWLNETSISEFYYEPKNSLDVIYIGGSNVYAHFNSTLAYNKYGFTTGLISSDSQPAIFAKYFIKEAEKYQNPDLYIIDLVNFIFDDEALEEGSVRKCADSMKFSLNRIDALNKVLPYLNVAKNEYINYYFSFFKYHNMWQELKEENFSQKNQYLYKGYLFSKYTSNIEPQEDYVWSNKSKELSKLNQDVLDDLIKYLKSTDLEVLFVIPKRIYNETESQTLNTVSKKLKSENFNVINFNTLDDFNVDLKNDLYNYGHLNVYGATKYTLYFSKYLYENYDLKDHRNDKKYSTWDSEYKRFKDSFSQIIGNDFDDLLNEYDI